MDYRKLIAAEFERRKAKNPKFSLRSFARELRLTPMHLLYVMRGERGISKKRAPHIAGVLGLRSSAVELFRFLVSAQSGRSRFERQLARQGLKRKSLQTAQKTLKEILNGGRK